MNGKYAPNILFDYYTSQSYLIQKSAMQEIKLVPRDANGISYNIPRDKLMGVPLLKIMLSDGGAVELPLPNINGTELLRFIEYGNWYSKKVINIEGAENKEGEESKDSELLKECMCVGKKSTRGLICLGCIHDPVKDLDSTLLFKDINDASYLGFEDLVNLIMLKVLVSIISQIKLWRNSAQRRIDGDLSKNIIRNDDTKIIELLSLCGFTRNEYVMPNKLYSINKSSLCSISYAQENKCYYDRSNSSSLSFVNDDESSDSDEEASKDEKDSDGDKDIFQINEFKARRDCLRAILSASLGVDPNLITGLINHETFPLLDFCYFMENAFANGYNITGEDDKHLNILTEYPVFLRVLSCIHTDKNNYLLHEIKYCEKVSDVDSEPDEHPWGDLNSSKDTLQKKLSKKAEVIRKLIDKHKKYKRNMDSLTDLRHDLEHLNMRILRSIYKPYGTFLIKFHHKELMEAFGCDPFA